MRRCSRADETTGRAAGALSWVHVACTQYLTLMHVGGRSSDDIDAGGVLPGFTGILIRAGYSGYAHLPAVHAWCGLICSAICGRSPTPTPTPGSFRA